MVRDAIYWTIAQALPATLMRASARRGDLQGQVMVTTASGGDIWGLLEQAHAGGALHRTRLGFFTADHAVVREILSGPDFRADRNPGASGLLGWLMVKTAPAGIQHPLEPPSLLVSEPPDHTRYRRLVSRVFTARAVDKLRLRAQEIAGSLLDQLDPGQPCDLVAQYCGQFPLAVIGEILGVPPADQPLVFELGARSAASLDFGLSWRQYREVDAALREFAQWLTGHVARLRREPGDDLLSQLIEARDEQGALDERELKATAGLVLAAGFETTVNLLGNAIALLDAHPEQLARLRADPALWANAVEETLRIDPPVLMTGRVSGRATTLAGTAVPAGAVMLAMLAGANRDPKVFPDPGRFDVARPNAREHLSFSAGRHFCLGASLARMEGEVGLRALYERFPGVRVLPGARRRPTRILRGYETLPAALT